MIKVGIVEDIKRLAEELKSKIELSDKFEVVFLKSNGSELLKTLRKGAEVDVLLMDIEMPVMSGIEATEKISKEFSQIKVIICSIYDDETSILDAILAGATGYLLKEEAPATIHNAIEQATRGGSPLNPMVARKTLRLLAQPQNEMNVVNDYSLTKRETEVLKLLAQGKSYDEIASILIISSGTIRKHIENLYRKLEVNNKIDAIRKLGKI